MKPATFRCGLRLAMAGMAMLALAACSGSTSITTSVCDFFEFSLSPTSASIAVGDTQQFTATALCSDGTTEDATASVTWASDSPSIAIVDSGGLATGVGSGTASISAARGNLTLFASLQVVSTGGMVTLTSVDITPASTTMFVGATQQYTATATYSDSSTLDITDSVTWSSSDTAVATITSGGVAEGFAAGSTTISATHASSGAADSTSLTVSDAPTGTGAGDTFTFNVDGAGAETVEEFTSFVAPEGFDPLIFSQLDQTEETMEITMRRNWLSGGLGFSETLALNFAGSAAGTSTFAEGAAGASYVTAAGDWANDLTPFDTTTTITVDSFGAVGEAVSGTFSAVLCETTAAAAEVSGSGSECADSAEQVALSEGAFNATRETNIGSPTRPKEIASFAMATVSSHTVLDSEGTNHYVVSVESGFVYAIDVTNLGADVDLVVYGSDDTFTTAAACGIADTTGQTGTASEQCVIIADGGGLYFSIAPGAGGGDITYDVAVTDYAGTPDLSIRIDAMGQDAGGLSRVSYTITNNGDGGVNSGFGYIGIINVGFHTNLSSPPLVTEPATWPDNQAHSIPAFGGTYSATINLSGALPSGGKAYIVVDGPLGQVTESDETNNVSPVFPWGDDSQAFPRYIQTRAIGGGEPVNTNLSVINGDGTTFIIGFGTGLGADSDLGYSGIIIDLASGQQFFIQVTTGLAEGGDYSLDFSGSGFSTNSLSATNPGGGEPDDSFDLAFPWARDLIARDLDSASDQDWFLFTAP